MGKELFIRFTMRFFSWVFDQVCVCPSFPFGIEGRMWDVIVLTPDHCLFIYLVTV